jgi:hypothetical protein
MVQMLAVQMVTGLLLPTRYVQRCPAPRCQFKMPDIFNQQLMRMMNVRSSESLQSMRVRRTLGRR